MMHFRTTFNLGYCRRTLFDTILWIGIFLLLSQHAYSATMSPLSGKCEALRITAGISRRNDFIKLSSNHRRVIASRRLFPRAPKLLQSRGRKDNAGNQGVKLYERRDFPCKRMVLTSSSTRSPLFWYRGAYTRVSRH